MDLVIARLRAGVVWWCVPRASLKANITEWVEVHAAPVIGQPHGPDSSAARAGELIEQGVHSPALGADHMRAHLPRVSVVCGKHLRLSLDRLANQIVDVNHCCPPAESCSGGHLRPCPADESISR